MVLDGYKKALQQHADDDNRILLALVDDGVIHVALNFYECSILPHNITNILFISVIQSACTQLYQLNIPCFAFVNKMAGKVASKYGTEVFYAKMNIRTNFLRYALEWGYSVLLSDIDMIYFRNPFPYFDCANCEIESLQDGWENYLNAGFLFIKSSEETISLYRRMVVEAKMDPDSEDQTILNSFVKQMNISYRVLDTNKFLCGWTYYTLPKRYFADTAVSCDDCVVVHNNWIVTVEAKVYRAKEMLHWFYDGDGYYTNPDARYIIYDNYDVTDFFNTQRNALLRALAIGKVLNRSVILPKFHCSTSLCPLNSFIYINSFDKSFAGYYREHSFLIHPKVPKKILDGKSPLLHIGFKNPPTDAINRTYFVPKNKKGADSEEIKQWFLPMSDIPILHFHSMKNSFYRFTDKKVHRKFVTKAKFGFRNADFMQSDLPP